MHTYEDGLQRCNANYTPQTPVDFQVRASEVYGDKTTVPYGQAKHTWMLRTECAPLAQALVEALPDLKIIEAQDTFAAADDTVLATVQRYGDLIGQGAPNFQYLSPNDDWDAIALNYTSSTTGCVVRGLLPSWLQSDSDPAWNTRPRTSLHSVARSWPRSSFPRRRTSANCPGHRQEKFKNLPCVIN